MTRYLSVGLGTPPVVAVPLAVGTAAAIGGLLALIQNAMDDDWAETTVFRSHAREIHSAMLAIQCMIGGSSARMVDTLGNEVCPGNTQPACRLPQNLVVEWRALRDGFGAFWAETSDAWTSPSNAEAMRLKSYARQFYAFYGKIVKSCRAQGAVLPSAPGLPDVEKEKPAPAWLKWTVGGVAFVSLAFIVRAWRK